MSPKSRSRAATTCSSSTRRSISCGPTRTTTKTGNHCSSRHRSPRVPQSPARTRRNPSASPTRRRASAERRRRQLQAQEQQERFAADIERRRVWREEQLSAQADEDAQRARSVSRRTRPVAREEVESRWQQTMATQRRKVGQTAMLLPSIQLRRSACRLHGLKSRSKYAQHEKKQIHSTTGE